MKKYITAALLFCAAGTAPGRQNAADSADTRATRGYPNRG